MRVVTGKFGGRNLKTLKGEATRPTTQRVKESLFSSLVSVCGSFDDLTVLDAFAGSGALGIEALSRGASLAVFFEKSRAASQVVRDNLTSIKAEPSTYQIEVGDSFRLAQATRAHIFDIVFCDPPYAIEPERVLDLIQDLYRFGGATAETLIYYELTKKNKPLCLEQIDALQWELVSAKDFGDTSYVIFRKGN